MNGWLVLAASLAYLLLLFAIAWHGDARNAASGRAAADSRAPFVYTLSLAVYCTSWTFSGLVGRAATDGFEFAPISFGPILLFALAWPVLAKMVRVAKAENVVSISDFLSARYGKSQAIAALVTTTAVLGVIPYIALQLKAIAISFEALTRPAGGSSLPGGTALSVAAIMAVFAILFGVRHINANEHHRGMMRAIAAESLVKLTAALTVGAAVTFGMGGGFGELAEAISSDPGLGELFQLERSLKSPGFWTMTLLAGLAIICLPRQFHVTVVENIHPSDVRLAAPLFPLYLFAINLFVMPVAVVGLLVLPGEVQGASGADTLMVSLPMAAGWPMLGLFAFIGCLSAATGMIIVEVVTLSTMVCNDVIVPLLLRLRPAHAPWRANPAPLLLLIRRSAVVGILALAYAYHRAIGTAYPLSTIGLVSFAAVAQFAPALLGGLFWSRGTKAGAISGIASGFALWAYTLMLPPFAEAGLMPSGILDQGAFAAGWLNPASLGADTGLDPLSHAVLWSLGFNLFLYVTVSLLTSQDMTERHQAARFVSMRHDGSVGAAPVRGTTLADLHALAARYVGPARADASFHRHAVNHHLAAVDIASLGAVRADAEAIRLTERLLAGAIGSASARVVVAGLVGGRGLSRKGARTMLDEASRAILKNHELLRATIENVNQGMCLFDRDFRVAVWNRRFLELLALPEGFVQVGTSLAEIVRHLRKRGEYGRNGEIQTLLARRSDEGRRGKPDIYERRRPDGTVLEIATNPMPDGGFVAVYTDVTDRHRTAAALREANESLERRIEERTRALAEASAAAERANLGKTRFLAAAGHDLMQPLHAARLFLSALAEKSEDPLIGQVDASLRSVEHLLGELLDVSKLDSGVIQPKPAVFRIEEVMRPLNDEFRVLAREHGLDLRMAPCAAAVASDPALLRRILQNFLANAVRYTARGRILMGCRRRGDRLRIEVWDTGPGIPQDKLKDIFVEFRQLDDRRTADRSKGLGLGLAIVERLAAILDHRVTVRSRAGRGSCFAVEVPLAAKAAAPALSLAASRPHARPRGRGRDFGGALVLCVDNEAQVANAMRTLLSGWGCEVVTAADPGQALAALGGRSPDAVLTDWHLDAGLTGRRVLQELRAALGAMPAAIVTADRGAGVRAAADELGCRLVHKPVRPGALRALVAQLLAEGRDAAE
jgi:Na+/proline symporter/signal transduction histidine kinase/CheY-like chemotaxis protein